MALMLAVVSAFALAEYDNAFGEQLGYKQISIRELSLHEGQPYLDSETKIAVSGFYSTLIHDDGRLYYSRTALDYPDPSQNPDYMTVKLVTENGSQRLRDYLLHCQSLSWCEVTILGHIGQCSERVLSRDPWGKPREIFRSVNCLVAEDMMPVGTPMNIEPLSPGNMRPKN
jgi:hypothetical protein